VRGDDGRSASFWKDESLLALRFGRWGFWWALLATTAAAAATFGVMLAVVLAFTKIADWDGMDRAWSEAMQANAGFFLGNPFSFYSFLAIGLAGTPAVWLAGRIHGLQGSAFLTLYGGFSWSRFRRMGGALVATSLPFLVLSLFVYGEEPEWSFAAFRYPLFVLTALVILALQTFAEEALFRGYLYHAWVRIFPYPVAVAVVCCAIFAAIHWPNPDVQRDPVPAIIGLLAFALFAQWLTVRTGSLDAAWGLHFANNVFATLGVNVKPGYVTDAPVLQFTDTLLAAGGSYALDPMTYVWLVLSFALTFWAILDRRSPFYIEPRARP
jgi:uncharacterized protein